MVAELKLMTIEEFARLDNDECSHELSDGELITMPPPGYERGLIVANLIGAIKPFVKAQGLGAVLSNSGFTIGRDPDTVLAPDIAYVQATAPSAAPPPRGYPEFLPDLVFEIVSPSDNAAYVQRKVQKYLSAGVSMVVVIWPLTRTVSVHHTEGSSVMLSETDQLSFGEIIPGFSVAVNDLFA
jgi:Uma2 family endonuclease